jgi:hypothetical protein
MTTHDRADRIVRNNRLFREANERISGAARDYAVDGLLPFICECAEPSCTRVTQLSSAEYGAVRADADRFFVVPGHERAEAGRARVVETYDRYLVVEKIAGSRTPSQ